MKNKVSLLKRKTANINFFNVNVLFLGDTLELSMSGAYLPFFLKAAEHSTASTYFHFSLLRKHLACNRPHHRLQFYFSLISLLCALCAFSRAHSSCYLDDKPEVLECKMHFWTRAVGWVPNSGKWFRLSCIWTSPSLKNPESIRRQVWGWASLDLLCTGSPIPGVYTSIAGFKYNKML